MLTPADIENKQFGTTRVREGYNQLEVDDFLDRAAAALTDALDRLATEQAEHARAKSQLAVVQRQLDAYGDTPTMILEQPPAIPQYLGDVSRILGVAQQTADEQIAEAKAAADRLRYEAAAEAEAVKQAAKSELYNMQGKVAELKETQARITTYLKANLTEFISKLEDSNGS